MTTDISTEDPIQLTQILTQIDSSNPELSGSKGAGESRIADYIASWLEHRQFETHRLENTPGRPSVVGILRGKGDGKSLVINGHMDTTSLASFAAGQDPLSGKISKDGKRIHGRGSADMKGGLAAAMAALASVKRPDSLSGDVIFTAVADEEHASIGTKEVLDSGLCRADGAVIVEPTQLNIAIAHKGKVWIEVEILGVAAHGSSPEEGVDAIVHAGHFLVKLEEYGRRLPEDEDLGKATLHAGLIKGGEEASSYPSSCKVTVEFRTVVGQTPEGIVDDIKGILADLEKKVDRFRYAEPKVVFRQNPSKTDPQAGVLKILVKATEKVFGSARPRIALAPWTDAALLHDTGIETVIFGPKGQGMHGADEWVEVESVKKTEEVLVNVIMAFCQ